jgi:signal transduction histidine kinase
VKPYLKILFVVIIALPLSALGALGVKLAGDEQEMSRVRMAELHTARLKKVETTVAGTLARVEDEILRGTKFTSMAADDIREVVRNQRIIRQIFVLSADGLLVHPPRTSDAGEAEKEFITRTKRLWQNGGVFKRHDDSESNPRPFGWHSWYWDEGINLIFWRHDSSGRTIGVELSRIVLLAEIVGDLPSTSETEKDGFSDRVSLVDASKREVYAFGKLAPDDNAEPQIRLALEPPLGAWSLRYFSAKPKFGKSLLFNLLLGLAAIGLTVIGLGFWVFRESGREIREATQRVSFVNQVSHELKTPLTNIRMYAELLGEHLEDTDEKTLRHLEVIISESQRLSRLIGNVLNYGRSRRGQLQVRPSPGQIDDVVERVVEQFRPSLSSRGIEIDSSLNAKTQGNFDADAIEQILSNLLGNVEKYAGRGKTVKIKSDQTDQKTTVSVTDNGPGIPAGATKKIFTPFYRVSGKVTEGVSGTGIGLAISRDLARLSGGDLLLEPTQGGACFVLSLKN